MVSAYRNVPKATAQAVMSAPTSRPLPARRCAAR